MPCHAQRKERRFTTHADVTFCLCATYY